MAEKTGETDGERIARTNTEAKEEKEEVNSNLNDNGVVAFLCNSQEGLAFDAQEIGELFYAVTSERK